MIKKGNIITITVFILAIYLILNVYKVVWFIVEPTNYFGLTWFLSISGVIIYFLVLIIFGVAEILKKGAKNRLPKFLLGLVLLIILSATFIPRLYFESIASSKFNYRYLEKAERYFVKGKFEKALHHTEKSFYKYKTIKTQNFWLVGNWVLKSNLFKKIIDNRKIQSSFAYGYMLESCQEYSKAKTQYNYCLDIIKEFQLKEYESIPIKLGLARICLEEGEISKAENLNNDFQNQLNKLKNREFKETFDFMFYYSFYLEQHGRINKAEEIRNSLLEQYIKSDESKKSSRYKSLISLVAKDDLNNIKLDKAQNRINYLGKFLNKKDILYESYLTLKAYLYELQGNLNESEKLHQQLIKESKRKHQSIYINNLFSFATFYYRIGKAEKAIELFNKIEKITNKNAVCTEAVLSNYQIGNRETAIFLLEKLDTIVKSDLNKLIPLVSSAEKDGLISTYRKYFDFSNWLYLDSNNSTSIGKVYNNILALKNIYFQSNIETESVLNNDGNGVLRKKYLNIKKQKELQETRILRTPLNTDNSNELLDSLSLLERELFIKIHDNCNYNFFSYSWENVKSSLSKYEAAVEIIRVPTSSVYGSGYKYLALIINSTSEYPQIVPLCEEKKLNNILNSDEKLYSERNLQELNDLIIEPIDKYLVDYKNIFLSVSGILHKVSFPALTITKPYNIHLYSSTYKVIDNKEFFSVNSVSLFGGVDYNTDSAKENNIEPKRFVGFPLLTETINEVNSIRQMIKKNNINCSIYIGSDANEKQFRRLSGAKIDVIHLATHGFFYEDSLSFIQREILYNINSSYSNIENSMNRSGFVLSNKDIITKSFEDDGVLTASEIENLDFKNTKLVVLSACETGLGDINNSEGVFGLLRAFKLAGVNTIIMSLWKVPDLQTSMLMQLFYKHWLNGMSKYDAFLTAQKEVRQVYPGAYYWAGFVMVD
jgi:CHAT domain-containing protein